MDTPLECLIKVTDIFLTVLRHKTRCPLFLPPRDFREGVFGNYRAPSFPSVQSRIEWPGFVVEGS